MKALYDSIINEAVKETFTLKLKEGKNIYDDRAKTIIVTGNVDYAELYIEDNDAVEVIDLSKSFCNTIRICVIQCKNVKEIIGGKGKNVFCTIRKNKNLEKLDLSNYDQFSDGQGGQMSYIDKNKKLDLYYDNLPEVVDAHHGLNILDGRLHLLHSNGSDKVFKLKNIKLFIK